MKTKQDKARQVEQLNQLLRNAPAEEVVRYFLDAFQGRIALLQPQH